MPVLVLRLVYGLALSLLMATASSASELAKLAIIIDDLGYNLPLGKRTIDLPGQFTVAVLPFTPHGRELAELADKRGKEVMLHAPMSNHHKFPLGRGGLVEGMGHAEFLAVLRRNLAEIPHVKGVNNHMGSLLTEQAGPMRWMMKELQSQQLYFVDSRTTALTQALIEAERIRLPSRRRDVFLDDKRGRNHVEKQLLLALEKAKTQGSAIAIGHPYPETLAVLKSIRPLLKRHQVELVSVSALMTPFGSIIKSGGYCSAPPAHLWPKIWVPVNPFDDQLFLLRNNFR